MRHRRFVRRARRILVALALCVVAGAACTRRLPAEAGPGLAEALLTSSPSFVLRHEPGHATAERTSPAKDVVLPNCTGSEPLHEEIRAPLQAQAYIAFEEGSVPPELAPYQGVMAAKIGRAYQSAGAHPPDLRPAVTLETPAGSQSEHQLVWREIWDQNVIDVLVDGHRVAEIPVSVLMAVELVSAHDHVSSCTSDDDKAGERVPLIILSSRPLLSEPAATHTTSEIDCPGLPGRTPAEDLVTRYVAYLNQADHASAYDLLGESYQARMPFRTYTEGYQPVQEIALCSLDSLTQQGGRTILYTTLRLVLDSHGREEMQQWTAQYVVDTDMRVAPTRQVITAVRMYRSDLGD